MTSSEINFVLIEEYLNNFPGGQVSLSREYYCKGLAVIYFSNPTKKNAISGVMMVNLRHCILELEQWAEGKAVLLCGTDGNFCSGGDLDFVRASGTPKEAIDISSWMQDTLNRLKNLPIISVCLVQGPTLGGGAEISVFCDFIITTQDAKYGFVQGKLGIITAFGGTTALVSKVGYEKALDLLLTAQVMTAEDLVINKIAKCIIPVENCFNKALEWIDTRIQHHVTVVRLMKLTAMKASKDHFNESLIFEKNLFAGTWGSDVNKEALAKRIKHVNK